MPVNERPTCVTVIGWAWIVVGGLMCFSAAMGILGSLSMGEMMRSFPESHQEVPTFVRLFPLIALVQVCGGALGLVSGVHFLKAKEWARRVLVLLTAVLLVFVVGFGIFWLIMWGSMTSGHAPAGFAAVGLIMGVFNTALFGVPLGIMLKYLVGDRVKMAMGASDRHSEDPPGTDHAGLPPDAGAQ